MELPDSSVQDADNRRLNDSQKRQRTGEVVQFRGPERRNSDFYFPPRERQFHSGPMVPSEYETLTRRLHNESRLLSRRGLTANPAQLSPRYPHGRGATETFIPTILLSPSQQHPPGMSFVDILICQNVELFQSNEEYDHGQNTGYVGLRCIHCARSGRTNLDRTSSIYPSSVEMMESGVRAFAKSHLLHCAMIPESIRVEFHNHEVLRTLDDSDHARRMNLNNEEALNQHCMHICSRLNIINKVPSNSGMVIGTVNYLSPITPCTFFSGVTADQQSQVDRSSRSIEDSTTAHSQWYHRSRNPSYHSIPNSPQVRRYSSDISRVSMNIPDVPPPHLQLLPPQPFPTDQHLSSSEEGISRTIEGTPFIQTAKNIWECKFCSNSPIGHRAPKHAWYSATPPDRTFMDEHLVECRGNIQSRLGTASLSRRASVNQIQDFNPSTSRYHPWNNQYYDFHPYSHSDRRMSPLLSNQSTHSSQNWRASREVESLPSQRHSEQQPFLPTGRTSTSPLDRQSVGAHSLNRSSYASNRQYDELNETNFDRGASLQHQVHQEDRSNLDGINQGSSRQSKVANVSTKEDFDAAIMILTETAPSTPSDQANGILVEEEDRHLITDYFYHVMRQIRVCSFEESDRKTRGGRQNNIEIGYKGLACNHCSHTTNARRFFWSNVDLLSNSFSEIPGHILRCKACPKSTKDALLELKKHNHSQMTEMPRGSQKTFLRRVWRRLHDESNRDDYQAHDDTDIRPSSTIVTVGSDSPDRYEATTRTSAQHSVSTSFDKAAKSLKEGSSSVLLAIDQDKEWGLTDLDCLVRKNIELFCASDHDASTENRRRVSEEHNIFPGQVGLRCIHCSVSPDHVTHCIYPDCLGDIFPSVARAFKKRHFLVCPCLPQDLKETFVSMKESSPSSYGSIVREYFSDAAQALGLRDNESGGIVATGVSKAIRKGS